MRNMLEKEKLSKMQTEEEINDPSKRVIKSFKVKPAADKIGVKVYITSVDQYGFNEQSRVLFGTVAELDPNVLSKYINKTEEVTFNELYKSDFEELCRALEVLYNSPEKGEEEGEYYFDTVGNTLGYYCELLANGELITNDGQCNWDMIMKLRGRGYRVYAGDKDSFGWLTGCIQKHGDERILVYG